MYLTFDLSLKCSGWAKFNNKGNLLKKGRVSPPDNLDNCSKIHYITSKLVETFEGVTEVIIEDLYYGKNFMSIKWLARLSGAVGYEWVKHSYKDPLFYTASHARKLAGINGHSHKAEIQLFVLKKFKFADTKVIKKYSKNVDKLMLEFKNKKIKKGQFNYRMDKISSLIDKDTNIGEDIADAIILGLAYKGDKNV